MDFENTSRECNDVAIMFLDIVGFTSLASSLSAKQTMYVLNKLFVLYDDLSSDFDVYKVETAGDCYIACHGIFEENVFPHRMSTQQRDCKRNSNPLKSTRTILAFAEEVIQKTKTLKFRCFDFPIQIRIGMHIGPVITGTIGSKLPKFSMFGDVMNVASRMESTSRPNSIQVTREFYEYVKDEAPWKKNEDVYVKNKGNMRTYICEFV